MADADDAIELKAEKRNTRKRHERDLPQEIVFSFLLHIPAQDLLDVMRHVCREWNLIIRSQNFIYHHLQNSTAVILFEDDNPARRVVYVEMRGGRLVISSYYWGFRGRELSSCNGLVLTHTDSRGFDIPYVVNPLTKQRGTLPPYDRRTYRYAQFSLAFVEASMEYKVVVRSYNIVYDSHQSDSDESCPEMQIAVLTIGVDRVWRVIRVERLDPATRPALMGSPLVTGGYMHWIGSNFLLTLNVETETFSRFPMTQLVKRFSHFLPMGSKLSAVDQSRRFLRTVWEMNPETGEWTMLLSFDLKPLRPRFKAVFRKQKKPFTPLGWLVAGEVLVFGTGSFRRHYIAYNVKTQEIQSFESVIEMRSCRFEAHVNSLVWLEGVF